MENSHNSVNVADKEQLQFDSFIAARSALRVFPFQLMLPPQNIDQVRVDVDISKVVFFTGRAVLLSTVKAVFPQFEIVSQLELDEIIESIEISRIGYSTGRWTTYAAEAAKHTFYLAKSPVSREHSNASSSAGIAASELDLANGISDAEIAMESATSTDTALSFEQLLQTPLWHDLDIPNWLAPFEETIDRNYPRGTFWREWYQGFLEGTPLDWELQRRVAEIPDEDWEQGPEHIAKLIEEIRARFELEKRIEALEAEKLVWDERARLGTGGNNPPEPLEDDRIIQEIIWAPIEDLKAETQSEAPDKSRIHAAISKLGAALMAIGNWPFEKLDKAADEFAKSLGKWGGGACAGWLALNSDKIAEIIKAAQAWLSSIL